MSYTAKTLKHCVIIASILASQIFLPHRAYSESFKISWYLFRAGANSKINNHSAAIEAYKKVLEINPSHKEAMRELGVSYYEMGLTDQMVVQFDRYLTDYPEDYEISFLQAKILSWSRYSYRRKDSLSFFREGLKFHEDKNVRYQFAKVLAQKKRNIAEAVSEYQKVIKDFPNDETIRKEYRELLLWDKKYLHLAVKDFEGFCQKYPKNDHAKWQLAKVYSQLKRYHKASARLYSELLKSQPKNRNLQLERARVLSSIRAKEWQSIKAFERYGIKSLKRRDRMTYISLLAGQTGHSVAARAKFNRFLKLYPRDTQSRLKYARFLATHKSTSTEAIKQFNIILKQDGKNASVHHELSKLHLWNDNNVRARHHAKLASLNGHKSPTITSSPTMSSKSHFGSKIENQHQPGSEHYDLNRFILAAFANYHMNSTKKIEVMGGSETLRSGPSKTSGLIVYGKFDYRINSKMSIQSIASLRTVGSYDPHEGEVNYTYQHGSYSFTPGIRHQFINDSLVSIRGNEFESDNIGRARELRGYISTRFNFSRHSSLKVTPFAGLIKSQIPDNNTHLGVQTSLSHTFSRVGRIQYGVWHNGEYSRYRRNQSETTLDGRDSGGYFSPRLFAWLNVNPGLSYRSGSSTFLKVKAGPSLKQINSETIYGVNSQLYLTQTIQKSITADCSISLEKFANEIPSYNIWVKAYHHF